MSKATSYEMAQLVRSIQSVSYTHLDVYKRQILRTTAFASLQDSKTVAGKLMVKGEVTLKILYTSVLDETMLETMEYAIPFSQMLDGSDFTDDCLCEVRLQIAGLTIQVKNDYSGEMCIRDSCSMYRTFRRSCARRFWGRSRGNVWWMSVLRPVERPLPLQNRCRTPARSWLLTNIKEKCA